jgi:hypothetical protein
VHTAGLVLKRLSTNWTVSAALKTRSTKDFITLHVLNWIFHNILTDRTEEVIWDFIDKELSVHADSKYLLLLFDEITAVFPVCWFQVVHMLLLTIHYSCIWSPPPAVLLLLLGVWRKEEKGAKTGPHRK